MDATVIMIGNADFIHWVQQTFSKLRNRVQPKQIEIESPVGEGIELDKTFLNIQVKDGDSGIRLST